MGEPLTVRALGFLVAVKHNFIADLSWFALVQREPFEPAPSQSPSVRNYFAAKARSDGRKEGSEERGGEGEWGQV